jgi:hypothetical protein
VRLTSLTEPPSASAKRVTASERDVQFGYCGLSGLLTNATGKLGSNRATLSTRYTGSNRVDGRSSTLALVYCCVEINQLKQHSRVILGPIPCI